MKKKTKRKPQDATFRNINALKKRVTKLESDMEAVYELIFPIPKKEQKK